MSSTEYTLPGTLPGEQTPQEPGLDLAMNALLICLILTVIALDRE